MFSRLARRFVVVVVVAAGWREQTSFQIKLTLGLGRARKSAAQMPALSANGHLATFAQSPKWPLRLI